MDTHLGSQQRQWHTPDWIAAAVAGFAAGAVLMVLDLIWSSIFAVDGPWRTSHMIAPIIIGQERLPTTGYAFSIGVVTLALATHYVLGIVFGLVMAAGMAQFNLAATPGRALVTGAAFGLVLYLINFHAIARFFPWLTELRGWETQAAHVVFGVVAALLYWRLKRTAR
jgi:hypothetical protein